MKHSKRLFLVIILCIFAIVAKAQIKGVVIDQDNGDSIAFVSVLYKGKHISSVGDVNGRFTISKRVGETLTLTAIGYKSKQIKITSSTPSEMTVYMQPDSKFLDEVTVKSKKAKYRRKENPAVELMRRVIASRQRTKLENKDFYQYRNYEKLTVSLNDMSKAKLDSGSYSKKPWLKEQIEFNPITEKYILPVIVNEKVSRKYYRKSPEKERLYIEAENSYGVNDLVETGDMFTTALKDVFSEIDIYDDNVRLLQYPFISPIGKDAIGFYRYYIVDTLAVDKDSCIQVSFVPNNQQDFGFRGDLWILKDSTLHVKKAHLSIPKKSDVNFVKTMSIDQEYTRLPSGDWVLSTNDMNVEITVALSDFYVSRTSRRNDYSFNAIDTKTFRGKSLEVRDPYCEMRENDYWIDNRDVPLSKGEAGMDAFLHAIKKTNGFGWLMVGLKAIMENYFETVGQGGKSKFDFGPISSTISSNDIDGLRLRLSGMTTANLNPHLFFNGYAAYGFKTKNPYYNTTVTYSFNKKHYTPDEFPIRKIAITSQNDIHSPSDKFMNHDKDNIFAAIRWSKVKTMSFFNQQKIDFTWEEDWGLTYSAGLNFEKNTGTGNMCFHRFGHAYADNDMGKYRISEVYVGLNYQPGQTYINSKLSRRPINKDAPIFNIKHTTGIKGFFGGEYNYNVTEAHIYKRIWFSTWGKADININGGIQWNQVPYPLLLAPAANLAYIWQPRMFELINNIEFLNDKYVSLIAEWDLNGKIFNRVPLLKKLQLRELIGINVLYGGLSDKNNPLLECNRENPLLMDFPVDVDGRPLVNVMNTKKPYIEVRVGIHNIFNLLSVEYVRRLTYTNLPTSTNHGVRFGFRLSF